MKVLKDGSVFHEGVLTINDTIFNISAKGEVKPETAAETDPRNGVFPQTVEKIAHLRKRPTYHIVGENNAKARSARVSGGDWSVARIWQGFLTLIFKTYIMATSKILLGFLAGAAIGGALGILLAPDKGEETRRKLMEKGSDLGDAFKDSLNDVKDRFNDVKEKFNDVVDEVKDNYSRMKGEAKNAN